MISPIYLGIDLGTQSVRVLAVDQNGHVVASSSHALQSHRDGSRHEQDPQDWWKATAQCLREVTTSFGKDRKINGIAVDATSGTILLADSEGKALTPGLMYDDTRAREEALFVDETGKEIWSQLGYRMQASWGLPKLLWLLRRQPLKAGTRLMHQNDFINARLARKVLSSDSSHSLKTGYDLNRSAWPHAVMDTLNIPPTVLPEVVTPGTKIGAVGSAASVETGIPSGTPIFAGMTDGCAAQIASGATRIGDWNTVIGTTLVIKGVTRERLNDPLGVIYSHRSPDGTWLPGGASSTGAGAIAAQFSPTDLPALNVSAQFADPTPAVIYPLVAKGERFPFIAPEAEGFVLGKVHSVEESYRGVLQGIAMIERLAFDRIHQLGALLDGRFFISGGAVKSEALNQIRADILQQELSIPAITEGAFGMAILAASSQSSLEECTSHMVKIEKTYSPKRPFSEYAKQYELFVSELHRRGWMPDALRAAAMTRLSS